LNASATGATSSGSTSFRALDQVEQLGERLLQKQLMLKRMARSFHAVAEVSG
jgi:hypothetical protein